MYVIIGGCGNVGSQLAEILSKASHNVVVIDKDQSAFEKLGSLFNGTTLWGNMIDLDVHKAAGIEKADAFVAVTNNDNANIMAAQMAKGIFKVSISIAKVSTHRAETIPDRFEVSIFSSVALESQAIGKLLDCHRSNECSGSEKSTGR